MKAAIFECEGTLTVKEVNEPKIKNEKDVKLKIDVASICGSDIHILSEPPSHPATPGIIQGHEFTGIVIEKGSSVNNISVGDRVLVDPTLVCGECYHCSIGEENICENFSTIGIFKDGGWAPVSVVPSTNIYKISKNVPKEFAVLAEPLSCVINGSEKLNIKPGENVLILGAGPMGQLFTQVKQISGAGHIIVTDISDYRLELVKQSGATHVINPQRDNLTEKVKEITGIGVDIVIDCVGNQLSEAIKLVRKGGQILLVGMNEQANIPVKQCEITKKEITIKGTIIQNKQFPKVVKILESNLLNFEHLITHKFKLEEIHEGIELMKNGEALKVMIYP